MDQIRSVALPPDSVRVHIAVTLTCVRGNMGNVGALDLQLPAESSIVTAEPYLTVLLQLSCHVKFPVPDTVSRFIDFCPRFGEFSQGTTTKFMDGPTDLWE